MDIIPGQGIRVSLEDYSRLRAFQSSGELWGREQQDLLRNATGLARFLPEVTEDPANDAAVFHLIVDGREVVSTSKVKQVRDIPVQEIRDFEEMLERLKELSDTSRDPRADPTKADVIRALRLPDPFLQPEFYRVYKQGGRRRLLVLWGCERIQGSSVDPMMATRRLERRQDSRGPLRAAALVALLLLLLLLGYLFWPKNTQRIAASPGGATTQPAAVNPATNPATSIASTTAPAVPNGPVQVASSQIPATNGSPATPDSPSPAVSPATNATSPSGPPSASSGTEPAPTPASHPAPGGTAAPDPSTSTTNTTPASTPATHPAVDTSPTTSPIQVSALIPHAQTVPPDTNPAPPAGPSANPAPPSTPISTPATSPIPAPADPNSPSTPTPATKPDSTTTPGAGQTPLPNPATPASSKPTTDPAATPGSTPAPSPSTAPNTSASPAPSSAPSPAVEPPVSPAPTPNPATTPTANTNQPSPPLSSSGTPAPSPSPNPTHGTPSTPDSSANANSKTPSDDGRDPITGDPLPKILIAKRPIGSRPAIDESKLLLIILAVNGANDSGVRAVKRVSTWTWIIDGNTRTDSNDSGSEIELHVGDGVHIVQVTGKTPEGYLVTKSNKLTVQVKGDAALGD